MPAPRTPSDRAAFLLYIFLSFVALGVWLSPFPSPRAWVTGAASALYLPFRAVSKGVENLLGLVVEREGLLTEAAELRRARVGIQELREENQRLRDQMDFARRDSLHLVPAWVLAKRSDRLGSRVLINRGQLDGVRIGFPVIGREGLVGRVDALEGHLSRVRLLTDRASAVSASIDRSHVDGIVEGDPVEGLRMRFVSYSADVKPGDVVVTSGLGGSFPPGLPVGRVRRLGLESGGLLRRIEIEPAELPERVQDVFVLAAGDSSRGWGFLWARPVAPTDSLAESVRTPRVEP